MLPCNESLAIFRSKIKSGLRRHCCPIYPDDNLIRIKVIGIINTVAFQKGRLCAEKLYQHLPYRFALPQITEMFQIDWHEYTQKMKREIGGKVWSLTRPVAIFINDEFIGSDSEFLRYINQSYVFNLPIELGYYESLITEQCKQFMENSKRKYVYFTFTIDGAVIGSFVFMLYSDLLPLTCQHFLNLCTGYNEMKEHYMKPYYINTHIHRIVKNGWIQCGAIELSEMSEDSVVDTAVTPDESYCIPHDRRGVLSMANDGKHCNESQFVVCLKPNPWMNYYYVAFGQLVDGARTLETLENISTYYEHPTKQIVISYCGEYLVGKEPKMEAESKIFLKHQKQPTMEGENMGLYDRAFNTYSITPWLDNIVDRIDVRDTASLLMAERYLNGLYCLSTDYVPGMDMHVYEKILSVPIETRGDITEISKMRELLMNFQPDIMTEEEKLQIISEISNIILAYIFNPENNEFCLQHISMDTRIIIHKILEIAHEIALKVISKAGKRSQILDACADLKINKIFKMEYLQCMTISETCLSLLREILNEAILHLMSFSNIQG